MPTQLITRITPGLGATVKGSPLSNAEIDANVISLNVNKLEVSNNLSELTDIPAARAVLNVPSRGGLNAFGTWPISVSGNSATSTKLNTARTINGVAFDGTQNIIITSATVQPLNFGFGISSDGNFNGSTLRNISIDSSAIVTITGAQTITGTKTFSNANISAANITGGSITGITPLAVASGGTGSSTAGGARSNLGLGTIATQSASNVAITGGTITGINALAIADGGTGATSAAAARANLELGTLATLDSPVPIANGGTAASTVADARTNLGLGTMATRAVGTGADQHRTNSQMDARYTQRLLTETAGRTTNYTLQLSDADRVVPMNATSEVTVTVPTNAAVAFPIGSVINIYRQGAGEVVVQGDTGVVVRNAGRIAERFFEVSLRKRATNEWVLSGDTF